MVCLAVKFNKIFYPYPLCPHQLSDQTDTHDKNSFKEAKSQMNAKESVPLLSPGLRSLTRKTHPASEVAQIPVSGVLVLKIHHWLSV